MLHTEKSSIVQYIPLIHISLSLSHFRQTRKRPFNVKADRIRQGIVQRNLSFIRHAISSPPYTLDIKMGKDGVGDDHEVDTGPAFQQLPFRSPATVVVDAGLVPYLRHFLRLFCQPKQR